MCHIDLDAQGFLELDPDREDLDRSRVGSEFDEEVDVTARELVSPCDRTEDRDGMPVVACDDGLDLISMSLDQSSQRS